MAFFLWTPALNLDGEQFRARLSTSLKFSCQWPQAELAVTHSTY